MFLLFDMGGTKTRVAVIGQSSSQINKKQVEIFPTAKTFEAGIGKIKATGESLAEGKKIKAIIGGVGAPLTTDKKQIFSDAGKSTLTAWQKKPLAQALKKEFGCPVWLENDTALGGLGEAHFGAGKKLKNIAYLTLGTGLGGARIVNGLIDRNYSGFEPGKQIVLVDEKNKKERKIEELVGGQFLEREFGKITGKVTNEKLKQKINYFTAIALANTTFYWSPEVIILGGSVSEHACLIELKSLFSQFTAELPVKPKIKRGLLGQTAGLYGALFMAKNSLK